MAIWEQQGGCCGGREVPVGSHVLLSLWSYQGTWPRGGPAVTLTALLMSSFGTHTHTHTHPTSEESRLVFVHNEDWWLCWWANWQTPQTEKRKKKGGKIKQDSYSSLRICGARAVQFSCLEPEAWQKRGPSWELTQDILLIKQPGRPHRDTDTDKRGNTVNSSETSSQMHLPLMSLMSSSENCAPKTESL